MEILYIVAVCFPVDVLMAKAIWRYFSRAEELADRLTCPPVGLVVQWLRQCGHVGFSVQSGLALSS